MLNGISGDPLRIVGREFTQQFTQVPEMAAGMRSSSSSMAQSMQSTINELTETYIAKIEATPSWRERLEITFEAGLKTLGAESGAIYFMKKDNGNKISTIWRGAIEGDLGQVQFKTYSDSLHIQGTPLLHFAENDALRRAVQNREVINIKDSSLGQAVGIYKPEDIANPKAMVFIPVLIPELGTVCFKFEKPVGLFKPARIKLFAHLLGKYAAQIERHGKKDRILLDTTPDNIVVRFSADYGKGIRGNLIRLISEVSNRLRSSGLDEVQIDFHSGDTTSFKRHETIRSILLLSIPTPPEILDGLEINKYFEFIGSELRKYLEGR